MFGNLLVFPLFNRRHGDFDGIGGAKIGDLFFCKDRRVWESCEVFGDEPVWFGVFFPIETIEA